MNQQTNEFYQEQQQRDLPQTLPSYPDVDGSGPAVEGVPDTPQTLPSYPAVQAGSLNVNVGSQRVASNLAFGNFSTYYCFDISFANGSTCKSIFLMSSNTAVFMLSLFSISSIQESTLS